MSAGDLMFKLGYVKLKKKVNSREIGEYVQQVVARQKSITIRFLIHSFDRFISIVIENNMLVNFDFLFH